MDPEKSHEIVSKQLGLWSKVAPLRPAVRAERRASVAACGRRRCLPSCAARASAPESLRRLVSLQDRPLTQFADGVWMDSQPARILGMQLTATMTILRLDDGSLLLYSPIAMTAARRAAVDALGAVAHLYSPNLYHHLHIGDWASAFPSARLHASPGLARKRPDLRIDRVHGSAPEAAFTDLIDELPIDGFRLEESVLVYRPARILLVADLVHNIGRPEHGWTKFYTRAMGFYDRVALSRMIRWLAFSDRTAARRSMDRLLALPFEHLIVGHGSPLSEGAKEAITAAFEWLPSSRHR